VDPINIFEDLKHKIIWLEIRPGATLNLVELAEKYKVSRTPIAIALARLHAEEWVSKHGSHYVVSLLTVEQMRDITELRTVLEQEAANWAMERLTESGRNDLQDLKQRMLELGNETDTFDAVKLDFEFHQIIYRETQNFCLVKIVEKMLCHYLRFWLSRPHPINTRNFFAENLAIMDALLDKDPEELDRAVFRHIRASLDEIMRL
jgi:DNA-binding GntR family transcriptional regulator